VTIGGCSLQYHDLLAVSFLFSGEINKILSLSSIIYIVLGCNSRFCDLT
jgi:hypothetical protein